MRTADPEAARVLNVLQGRDGDEQDLWWERLRGFNDRAVYGAQALDGWAFAGNLKADFGAICRRLVRMGERELGDRGGVLPLHFLGIGRLEAAVLYTFLQRALRKHVNPRIAVTYDAASPFVHASRGEGYTGWSFGPRGMSLTTIELPRNLNGSEDLTRPWPQQMTALGRRLTLADLCVNPPGGGRSTWDAFSYVLAMHMNLDVHLRALEAAQALAEGQGRPGEVLPAALCEFRDAVDEIFRRGRIDAVERHRRLFLELLPGVVTRSSRQSLATTFSVHEAPPRRGPEPLPPDPYEEWLLDERHEEAAAPLAKSF